MNNNILYISIDLDNESRRRLKYFCEEDVAEHFGDDAVYKCHHMTISHCSRLTPEILTWCQENNGKEFTLYVDTIGFSEKAIAVGVDVDSVVSTQAYPHITVAVNSAVNGKPVDSNYIKDFEDVYENIVLKGKLTFHYKGERDNTTLLESCSNINEWVSVDDNEDIQAYLNGYPGEDFNPEDIGSYELMQWCRKAGDFLYAYPFPIGFPSLRLRAANSDSIVEDIVNDIDQCAYIEQTHEIDELLFNKEDEFRDMYVAVFKICGIPDEKDYYVVYQEER